jgi:sugar phosphate isomerase/epimerase
MRIGMLSGSAAEFDFLQRLGFTSTQWMRFAESPAAPPHADWHGPVAEFHAQAGARGIRISAIGAYYRNPLDPKQTNLARAVFQRAIEVAEHIGVKTVSGFAGAVIEVEINERGGNPVYKPLENYLGRLLDFWEPLASFAADHGVRIAFENCPQGPWSLPVMHYNFMAQPALWEQFFNETKWENLGLEWDPSHLLCQFIDPVANLRKFASRIFHVHAKDAFINRTLLETYGICHPGVAEHRFPGMGQANWAEIVHELLRANYDSDLNIEGWHDPVYRNHPNGPQLEEAGLLIAQKTLAPFVPGTE